MKASRQVSASGLGWGAWRMPKGSVKPQRTGTILRSGLMLAHSSIAMMRWPWFSAALKASVS
jgi:hypothetical protein